jgi:hypothetical protein
MPSRHEGCGQHQQSRLDLGAKFLSAQVMQLSQKLIEQALHLI